MEPSGWPVVAQPQAGVSLMTWWYSQYGAIPDRLVRPDRANGVRWSRSQSREVRLPPGQAQTGWRARSVSVTSAPGSWRLVDASRTAPLGWVGEEPPPG